MKKEIDKQVDQILQSMHGAQRVKIPIDLFEKIEQNIFNPESKIIPISSLRWIAAAAVLLIFLNVWGIRKFQANPPIETSASSTPYQIKTDYKIYE